MSDRSPARPHGDPGTHRTAQASPLLGLSGERHSPRQAAIGSALPVGTPLLAGKPLSGLWAAAVGPLEEVA